LESVSLGSRDLAGLQFPHLEHLAVETPFFENSAALNPILLAPRLTKLGFAWIPSPPWHAVLPATLSQQLTSLALDFATIEDHRLPVIVGNFVSLRTVEVTTSWRPVRHPALHSLIGFHSAFLPALSRLTTLTLPILSWQHLDGATLSGNNLFRHLPALDKLRLVDATATMFDMMPSQVYANSLSGLLHSLQWLYLPGTVYEAYGTFPDRRTRRIDHLGMMAPEMERHMERVFGVWNDDMVN
jgi:hypothetical protein